MREELLGAAGLLGRAAPLPMISAAGELAMPQLNGILEAALYVEDVQRSAAFYRDVFGIVPLIVEDRFASLSVAGRSVLLLFKQGGSVRAAVTPGGVIPPHDGRGPIHMAFSISPEAFDGWTARLREAGVAIESTVNWPRGGKSIYVRDPDGNSIELVTPGTWAIY